MRYTTKYNRTTKKWEIWQTDTSFKALPQFLYEEYQSKKVAKAMLDFLNKEDQNA